MDTPYLITNTRFWERAEDPSKLINKDLLNAVILFVNCCYPWTTDKLKRKFETFSTEQRFYLTLWGHFTSLLNHNLQLTHFNPHNGHRSHL